MRKKNYIDWSVQHESLQNLTQDLNVYIRTLSQ